MSGSIPVVPHRMKDGYEPVSLLYAENFPFALHKDQLPTDFLRVLPHFHKEIEILHFIQGEALVCFNRVQTRVRAGDTVLVGPYSSHAVEPDKNGSCSYYTMMVSLDMIPELSQHLYYPFHLITDDRTITAHIETIVEEYRVQDTNYRLIIRNHLSLLFATLLRKYDLLESSTLAAAKSFSKIKPIIKYIHEHFTEKITIGDLCGEFHTSESSLSDNFNKAIGKSVVQYINILRCQNAYALISSEKHTVSEAAYLSGFQNLSYFTRKFKEYYGILPSDSKPNR